jgi:hypothetical protein
MKKVFLFALTLAGISLIGTASAHAAGGFIAGNIIDDNVFTNKSSMSSSAIQSFLNGKVPTCDTWGTQPSEFGGGTRRQWAEAHGHPAPYTCLKDYSVNGKSAARIIYDVAQQYSINPQVLIVLLQKEQGLVTDTWPLDIQYKTATGYGCPDTAPCDSQYYGLTNQLTWAAKMYRAILNDSPTWYTPYTLGTNYIQYNPVASCGGSNVYIQNRSTQALYNYTPYQPNAGALNAGWGTAQCGSYGNRNFYLYFTSWFGSTHTMPYAWNLLKQQAYTDQSLSTTLPFPTVIKSGDRVFMTVVAQNIGTATWKNSGSNPVRLGTSNTQDRTSSFCGAGWINCSRPALLTQSAVKPGQTGTFGFWATAPAQSGSYFEGFNLVAEGVTWLNDPGLYFPINVVDSYRWSTTGLSFYKDAGRTQPISNDQLMANTKYYVRTTVQNKGNVAWSNTTQNPIRLAPSNPRDQNSTLCSTEWINCKRIVRMNEASVAVSGTGTFDYTIKTTSKGQFTGQNLELVQEGTRWFDSNYTMWTKSNDPSYTWAYFGTTFFSDATKTQQISPTSRSKNQRVYVELSAKNTGNVPWLSTGSNPVRLGTFGPQDRSSNYYDSSWLTYNRVTGLKQSSVAPGDTGTFEFWMKAPAKSGSYKEYFNLLAEGYSWMKDIGLVYSVTVH